MDIKYIEKKMEKIIPKGVSLLEFMTFCVIVMSTYIFSNFSLLRLNRKMIREIIYIFSFKNIFVLTIFVLIFVVIDKFNIRLKLNMILNIYFCTMELLTKKFIELYFLFYLLYLSSFVLLNQKLNEYNTYEMICFLFLLFLFGFIV